MQAAFHAATSVGLFLFYWPAKNVEYPKMRLSEYIWACDPIGSLLFICSATLLLLALDWAGGSYAWSDAHVAAPLAVGLAFLLAFSLYGKQQTSHHGHLIILKGEYKARTRRRTNKSDTLLE